MTASEYVTTVMPSGVFTTEEDLAILMNIQGRAVPLPPPVWPTPPTPDSEVGVGGGSGGVRAGRKGLGG